MHLGSVHLKSTLIYGVCFVMSPYLIKQMRVWAGITKDQKRKETFQKSDSLVKEAEARQHVWFGGLSSGLTNKSKYVALESVSLLQWVRWDKTCG